MGFYRLISAIVVVTFLTVQLPSGTQWAQTVSSPISIEAHKLASKTFLNRGQQPPSGSAASTLTISYTKPSPPRTRRIIPLFVYLLFFVPPLAFLAGCFIAKSGSSNSASSAPAISGPPEFQSIQNSDEDTQLLLFIDPKDTNVTLFRINIFQNGAPLLVLFPPVPANPQDPVVVDLPFGTRGPVSITVQNASGDLTQSTRDSDPSQELTTNIVRDTFFTQPQITPPQATDGGPNFELDVTLQTTEDVNRVTALFGRAFPIVNGQPDKSQEQVVNVIPQDGIPNNFVVGQPKPHFVSFPETLPDGTPFPIGNYEVEILTLGDLGNASSEPAQTGTIAVTNTQRFPQSPNVTATSVLNSTTIQLDVTPTRNEVRAVEIRVNDSNNQPVLDANGNPLIFFNNFTVDSNNIAEPTTFFIGLPQTGTFNLEVVDFAPNAAFSQPQTASVTATVLGSPFSPIAIVTEPDNTDGDLRVPFDFNVGTQSVTPASASANVVEVTLDGNGNVASVVRTIASVLPVAHSTNSGNFDPSGLNESHVDLIDPQTGQPLNVVGLNLALEVIVGDQGLTSPPVLTAPFTVTTDQSPITGAPDVTLIPTPVGTVFTNFGVTLDPTTLTIPATSSATNYEVTVRQNGNVVDQLFPPVDFDSNNVPIPSELVISVPSTGLVTVEVAAASRQTQPSPIVPIQVSPTQVGTFLSAPNVSSPANVDGDNTLTLRVDHSDTVTHAVFRVTPQGQPPLPDVFIPLGSSYDPNANGVNYDLPVDLGITGIVDVEVADFHPSVGVGPFSSPQTGTITTSGTLFNTPTNVNVTVPDPAQPHIIQVTFDPNNPVTNPFFGDSNVAIIQVDIPGRQSRFEFPPLTSGTNTVFIDLGQGTNNFTVDVFVGVGHLGQTSSALAGPVQIGVQIASAMTGKTVPLTTVAMPGKNRLYAIMDETGTKVARLLRFVQVVMGALLLTLIPTSVVFGADGSQLAAHAATSYFEVILFAALFLIPAMLLKARKTRSLSSTVLSFLLIFIPVSAVNFACALFDHSGGRSSSTHYVDPAFNPSIPAPTVLGPFANPDGDSTITFQVDKASLESATHVVVNVTHDEIQHSYSPGSGGFGGPGGFSGPGRGVTSVSITKRAHPIFIPVSNLIEVSPGVLEGHMDVSVGFPDPVDVSIARFINGEISAASPQQRVSSGFSQNNFNKPRIISVQTNTNDSNKIDIVIDPNNPTAPANTEVVVRIADPSFFGRNYQFRLPLSSGIQQQGNDLLFTVELPNGTNDRNVSVAVGLAFPGETANFEGHNQSVPVTIASAMPGKKRWYAFVNDAGQTTHYLRIGTGALLLSLIPSVAFGAVGSQLATHFDPSDSLLSIIGFILIFSVPVIVSSLMRYVRNAGKDMKFSFKNLIKNPPRIETPKFRSSQIPLFDTTRIIELAL